MTKRLLAIADTNADTSMVLATDNKADAGSLENDYDELVDEDWLDMDNLPTSAQLTLLDKTPLSIPADDDHQVPSLPLSAGARQQSVGSSASAVTGAPATVSPATVGLSGIELHDLQLQLQEHLPGSTSPSPSSHDSEYSLLDPSTEQSRKNSMSSITGFHALTPTSPSTSVGDDFSGIESASVGSFNNGVPSSVSSDRESPSEDDNEDVHVVDDTSDKSDNGGLQNSLDLEPISGADYTVETAPVTLTFSALASPPASTPARRAMYRTTVENAASDSEDERGLRSLPSGMRHRGFRIQQGNPEDLRQPFFNASAAIPTMPGAFTAEMDAEIPQRGQPTTPAVTATATNDQPVEERQCRICLGGVDEEDTLGRLISPCLCKGSMKYVHVECLNAWRARSPKPESHYKCDTCKYSFSFRRTSFARYLAHPLTVFVLTMAVFAAAVFAAGFAMKLFFYLMMDEPQEFIYPADLDDYDDVELLRLKESVVIFRTPDSLRAVFRIDKSHMVFGSFFVSIIGFLQLLLSALWMGGGGGVFRIGGFGLGGGRRRGARGERQREAGIGGMLMVMILVFGLFKSLYMTYQFVHRVSRRVLAKAEMMVLEVQ
ncbi:hypothetical protein BC939DRAFT_470479 [Gamsiella multidivaricata]|uniref:uncharacterized protein n=1 Tax=Gamsiella multidivaricata TaxID=101098 RepID=UPI0022202459|nr:uncharacterized protein BC939DRAFT_470479 [Gamsiella multidivaricata]KAG0360808.1 hypothetical protein BGZ54_009383 [Gamsiella multidivaricata]KAI7816082.1 hypothetical protein BC939DRAFT_470479 [Gamsiella multidivaricata]